jgi:hypothetical protein
MPEPMPEQKPANPFVKNFIPGLVIGIICGGLAGAFLPPYLERWGMTPAPKSSPTPPRTSSSTARDTIPGSNTVPPRAPDEPEIKPADPVPVPATPPSTTEPTPAVPPEPAPK